MELMLAVAVLIVVILATAKIFSTVSKVASIGEGAIEIMQDVGAVQRQIQSDLADVAPEGFFAIRCVAVRNNVNQSIPPPNPSAPLLNPALPPDAWIRADQLMFFTNAPRNTKDFVGSADLEGPLALPNAYAAISRVYYGHGFQLFPAAEALGNTINAAATLGSGEGVFPWTFDAVPDGSLDTTLAVPAFGFAGTIVATQPPAPKWILTRQTVLLGDDGADEHFFFSPVANSVPDIWDIGLRNSRFDIAARQLNDIRRAILVNPAGSAPSNWDEQRNKIGDAMAYPRVERLSYTMSRVDQLLTASALAGACSSFIIDWTYDNGTGEVTNQRGQTFAGVFIQPGEQPWFGLDMLSGGGMATGDAPGVRGVSTFTGYVHRLGTLSLPQPASINVYPLQTSPPVNNSIERIGNPPVIHMLGTAFTQPGSSGTPIRVYEAIFGFNQSNAINPLTPTGTPDLNPPVMDPSMVPQTPWPYTPWPSAIRITMTLHDSNTRLESGREVQFVLHLPRRGG